MKYLCVVSYLLTVSLGAIAGTQVQASTLVSEQASLPTQAAMLRALPPLSQLPGFRALGPPDVVVLPEQRIATMMVQRSDGALLTVRIITWNSENRPILTLKDNPAGIAPVDDKAVPLRLSDFTLQVRRPVKGSAPSTYTLAADVGRTFILLELNAGATNNISAKSVRVGQVSSRDKQAMEKLLVAVATRARSNGLILKMPLPSTNQLASADRAKRNADLRKNLNQLHISENPSIEQVATSALSAIKKGASPDVESSEGIRALHIAAFLDDEELAKLAIEKGANVNARDRDGITPLHFCAQSGSQAVACLLLANGADKNLKNKDSKTPLQVAEEYEQQALIRILRAAK